MICFIMTLAVYNIWLLRQRQFFWLYITPPTWNLRTSCSTKIHMRSSCCRTSVQLSSSGIPRSSLVAKVRRIFISPWTLDLAVRPSRQNHLSIPDEGMSWKGEGQRSTKQCQSNCRNQQNLLLVTFRLMFKIVPLLLQPENLRLDLVI